MYTYNPSYMFSISKYRKHLLYQFPSNLARVKTNARPDLKIKLC